MAFSMTTYLLIAIIVIGMIFIIVVSFFANKNSKWRKFGISPGGKHCPKCGNRLPIVRKPKNTNQALFGGWTCKKCKSEVDKFGNLMN